MTICFHRWRIKRRGRTNHPSWISLVWEVKLYKFSFCLRHSHHLASTRPSSTWYNLMISSNVTLIMLSQMGLDLCDDDIDLFLGDRVCRWSGSLQSSSFTHLRWHRLDSGLLSFWIDCNSEEPRMQSIKAVFMPGIFLVK